MVQTVTGAYTAAQVHAEGTYFEPCKLRTHSADCPKPLTPHHCVPDHCWKADGKETNRIELNGADPSTMGTGSGLCICVDGSGKNSDSSAGDDYEGLRNRHKTDLKDLKMLKDDKLRSASEALAATFKSEAGSHTGTTTNFNNMGKHGKIHHIFDAAEDELAELNKKATPSLGENVATLSQLENLAATVIAKVTGCDAEDLKRQMRSYHNSKGIRGETLLRARAKGGAPAKPHPPNALGQPTYLSKAQRTTARQGVSTFLNGSYARLGI